MKIEMEDCVDLMKDVLKSSAKYVDRDDSFKKSLTFNPMNPQTVEPETHYYNPYFWVHGANGGYAPHHSAHFREQGSDVGDGYRLNDQFWQDNRWGRFEKSMKKLKDLSKSIDSLIKFEGV